AGTSAFVVAVLSPLLGAITDARGRRKPWLAGFTALCVIGTAALWYALPAREWIAYTFAAVVIANIGYEFGNVFYNAMLGDITDRASIGRWSGWAWALGYGGGLVSLVFMLVGFVLPEKPWFGVTKEDAENIRIVGPFVAAWFAVFALPTLLYTADRPATGIPIGVALRDGLASMGRTVRNARRHANAFRFLIARMIYNDGLMTIFAIGGIYAAGRYGMGQIELIQFGILLNVTAGLGAFGFAWLDDKKGAKCTLVIALVGLSAASIAAVIAPTAGWFWIAGAALGIFVGPAQAASRSLMTRIAPPEASTEFFGLYALSGRATAFAGPIAAGLATQISGDQSVGLATVVIFFMTGLFLLMRVAEPVREAEVIG
ncbi:MAG: MFS transporter, partial [Alphaproteobacteria bacterium]|nr:MFS transporter [Alphaproteobacteria bacterium]